MTATGNYLDGGEAILRAFRALGMDYVMASPGSEWGPLWEAFARQELANAKGPTYLSCAHELTAVDLAMGYTAYTGRMQAVMLHAGVGLLQGAMGIEATRRMVLPMMIVSGEALTYGEEEAYNPGPQWQAALSVAAGMARLVEPITKWSQQVSSTATMYQQLITAGEMAQRAPRGPVYMAVPIKTMRSPWTPPKFEREVPPAPKLVPAHGDIEAVADLLAAAERPAILTEEGGREPDSYAALLELAELLAIPVAEGGNSQYANFPKHHPLHQGHGRPDFLFDADVVLTVRCRAPWYPPTNRPAKATLIAIDENPFRPHMAYSANVADRFLEGDVASTLTLLAAAARGAGFDKGKVEARRQKWAEAHIEIAAANEKQAAQALAAGAISPVGAMAALAKAAPEDTVVMEEVVTHRGAVFAHAPWTKPQSYFRAQGGLGQGLGAGLGIKLAAKERPVVVVIGDGSFLYNPVIQSLALSHEEELPITVMVMNNHGYEAMKGDHLGYYPDGVAAQNDLFYGRPITEFDYAELARPFGGFGASVGTPGELGGALENAFKTNAEGKLAIVNVALTK
jgi:acetolactate synthase-1/2/3 large subunit